MKRTYRISEGRVVEDGNEACPIWVYINPDEGEKRFLTQSLEIDEHTLTSALDPDELPRLELEPDHVVVIYKRPKNYSAADLYLFKVASMGLFLFKERLVVVLAEECAIFEGRPFAEAKSLIDVVLKTMYRSVFHYLEHLKVINMLTDEVEKKISASMENKHLMCLFSLEKSLVYYVNALHLNGGVIDKLRHASSRLGFTEENTQFLEDLAIENSQCVRQAEIYSNILAGLMDARVSIVSNNLNHLMKTLNVITIGIMVPTLVVSAFSMNVHIPIANHPYAFWLIMGLALLSVVAFMVVWRFRKWN